MQKMSFFTIEKKITKYRAGAQPWTCQVTFRQRLADLQKIFSNRFGGFSSHPDLEKVVVIGHPVGQLLLHRLQLDQRTAELGGLKKKRFFLFQRSKSTTQNEAKRSESTRQR